ncbi:MAG: 16S rRNA (adenine(1518)-N(6)/adenine(1519)-N(6))-dimethyltransferase RsmA [Pseudomonadota bacterium]
MKHKARKRFGQNFLTNQSIILQIIQTIGVQAEDHIVEVGPGKGALTRHLLSACNNLDAIELDRDLIPLLKISLASYSQKFNLINQDILTVDLCQLVKSNQQTIRVIGNLPYNISTPVLFHFMQYRHCIKDMFFMLQKEVVDRLAATPGNKSYGRLSIIMQYYFNIEKCFDVPPSAFQPAPKVDSAIVTLVPYSDLNTQHGIVLEETRALQDICQLAFGQRRKTLRNNLKKVLSSEQITELDIDPSVRAETLTLYDFIKLANLYYQQNKSSSAD